MLMNEVSKETSLTKKAIEYYMEQGLICPKILKNGYRQFSQRDIESLKKISVLRKLGLGTEEIKEILCDGTGNMLSKYALRNELKVQREEAKKSILDRLSSGRIDYGKANAELMAISIGENITDKLLDAFPGHYGRFICLHFARFLNEPILSDEQQKAYQEIIGFLDNAPELNFPQDVQEYLMESTKYMSTNDICQIIDNTKKSIDNPEEFLSENKNIVKQYLAFNQSDEYKKSPMYEFQRLLLDFNKSSGYYDVFIPAMKRLSIAYDEYSKQLASANDKFLALYPEIYNSFEDKE